MECNRDEATRAKEIAEKKFTANDFSGAKRFALKAQTLYPDLKGLSQMLAILDVHLSAQNKIDGEVDLYGILGVDPLADDKTIKKQYRKLVLMIHYDKNKSAGADEAFRLITDARNLLCDNSKRKAYDQKRFPKTSQQHNHVPPAAATTATAASGMGVSSTPPPPEGSTVPAWASHLQQHNQVPPAATAASGMRVSSTPPLPQGSTVPADTFTLPDWALRNLLLQQQQNSSAVAAFTSTGGWGYNSSSVVFLTKCSHCKMQYTPPLVYLNQLLRCSICYQFFWAVAC